MEPCQPKYRRLGEARRPLVPDDDDDDPDPDPDPDDPERPRQRSKVQGKSLQ